MTESLAQPDVEKAQKPAQRPQPDWLAEGVVITINSNKGGVGKTTVLLLIAYYLILLLRDEGYEFEILLIDWDPQCNLSTCLGFQMDGDDGRGAKDDQGNVIQGALYSTDDIITTPIDDVEPGWAAQMIEPIRWVIKSATGNPIKHSSTGEVQPDPINEYIKIIPGHPDMALRFMQAAVADFRMRLDHALQNVKRGRIVLVDTGPGLGPEVEVAWAASDHVLGVAPLYYNEMEGVLKSRNRIHRIRRALGRPTLDMDGVVLNEYSEAKSTQSRNLGPLMEAIGEDRIWVEQAIPDVEQLAQIMDQGKSFGRLYGEGKKKINEAGMALAKKVYEVISGARETTTS